MCDSEQKASVLVLTSTFPRWKNDTAPSFVLELCKRLNDGDMKIDVLAPHAPNARYNEKIDGVNVYRYKYFFSKWELLAYNGGILENLKNNKMLLFLVPFFIIAQTIALISKIQNNNYEVIHSHWFVPQGLIAVFVTKVLYKNGPKLLCTSHGSDLFSLNSSFFYNIKKWVLMRSDVITVVSENMRNVCLQILNVEKNIYVCPMGVDLAKAFKPNEKVSRDINRILFVGRLISVKGVSVLLDSFEMIAKKHKNAKLTIVGDGAERNNLERKCQAIGIKEKVDFTGALNQKELPDIYSSAAVVVMPSLVQEGFGLVAIEAMGCGCAVILSSSQNDNDIIEHENNGLLIKPGDKYELADAIDSLLSDSEKLKRIAFSGIQTVSEKFDWDIVAKKYKNIIESVLE